MSEACGEGGGLPLVEDRTFLMSAGEICLLEAAALMSSCSAGSSMTTLSAGSGDASYRF